MLCYKDRANKRSTNNGISPLYRQMHLVEQAKKAEYLRPEVAKTALNPVQ